MSTSTAANYLGPDLRPPWNPPDTLEVDSTNITNPDEFTTTLDDVYPQSMEEKLRFNQTVVSAWDKANTRNLYTTLIFIASNVIYATQLMRFMRESQITNRFFSKALLSNRTLIPTSWNSPYLPVDTLPFHTSALDILPITSLVPSMCSLTVFLSANRFILPHPPPFSAFGMLGFDKDRDRLRIRMVEALMWRANMMVRVSMICFVGGTLASCERLALAWGEQYVTVAMTTVLVTIIVWAMQCYASEGVVRVMRRH